MIDDLKAITRHRLSSRHMVGGAVTRSSEDLDTRRDRQQRQEAFERTGPTPAPISVPPLQQHPAAAAADDDANAAGEPTKCEMLLCLSPGEKSQTTDAAMCRAYARVGGGCIWDTDDGECHVSLSTMDAIACATSAGVLDVLRGDISTDDPSKEEEEEEEEQEEVEEDFLLDLLNAWRDDFAAAWVPPPCGDGDGDGPTAAAVAGRDLAAMPSLVYLASDVDFHMFHYLRDHETRAVCVDTMQRMDAASDAAVIEAYHALPYEGSPKLAARRAKGPSFDEDTGAFRPWPGADTADDARARAAFAALAGRRLRDEGFADVCVHSVGRDGAVLGFSLRGIARRLDFVVGDALAVFAEGGAGVAWTLRDGVWAPPWNLATLATLGNGNEMLAPAVRALARGDRDAGTYRLIASACDASARDSGHCEPAEDLWRAALPGDTVVKRTDVSAEYPTVDTLSGEGTSVVVFEIEHVV